ncbi:MAG: hypothetical protein WC477_00340 [Patescibacteria group bacterium]
MFKRLKPLRFIAGGLAMLAIAQIVGAPAWLRAFVQCFLIIVEGYEVGSIFFPGLQRFGRIAWGSLTTLASYMILRVLWFYAGWNLNSWGEWIPLFITIAILSIVCAIHEPYAIEKKKIENRNQKKEIYFIFSILSTLISIGCFALIAFSASHSATTDAIRTPWPLLPEWTLALIAVQWILLAAGAWRNTSHATTYIQAVLCIASITIIAPLVYSIGYGFDGFLHVAGEQVFLKTGILMPKPPYYMGQYVFVTWISQMFEVGVAFIDRFLVPISAALILPAAISASTNIRSRSYQIIALVFLPFSAFIATTPHGFSTILAVAALLLAIGLPSKRIHPAAPLIFAAWSALTHPLVGLPIFIALIAATCVRSTKKWARVLSWICAIAAGISVPLVFGASAFLGSSAGVHFDLSHMMQWDTWKQLFTAFIPLTRNTYALWPQITEWVIKLMPWAVILFAVSARIRSRDERGDRAPWLTTACVTAIAAALLHIAGDFGFLIDYERGNYASRLWMVAGLLLLPLAIPEAGRLLSNMKRGAAIPVAGMLVTIGVLVAANAYAALPRYDASSSNRGWSVGMADIEAVKLIDEDSGGTPYTVLANQSVSAAAVRTYGFKRYNNDVFFYPIPTGGDLYQIYLKASYGDPSRATIAQAAKLGGSKLVYLVINNYWWDADALIEKARASADRVFTIEDGKVTVMKYVITTLPLSLPSQGGKLSK